MKTYKAHNQIEMPFTVSMKEIAFDQRMNINGYGIPFSRDTVDAPHIRRANHALWDALEHDSTTVISMCGWSARFETSDIRVDGGNWMFLGKLESITLENGVLVDTATAELRKITGIEWRLDK